MNYTETKIRHSERGGASIKFMLVVLVLFLVAHAGYKYVPVAYESENFKQEMQTAVIQGMAAPVNINPLDMTKGRLQRAIVANNIPSDAIVQVKSINGTMTAHVYYEKKVEILPFNLYNYTYKFDHTATPTGFLMKDSASIK